jgi:hypothetical protein
MPKQAKATRAVPLKRASKCEEQRTQQRNAGCDRTHAHSFHLSEAMAF